MFGDSSGACAGYGRSLGVEVLGNTVRVHSKDRNGADIARVVVRGGGHWQSLRSRR